MPAVARKLAPDTDPEPRLRTYHATVLVTRAEEWFVEAATEDEARALLAAGQGHRSALGERVHVEIERMLDDAA